MFCKNCGAEMNDTAKFCPKCGNDRTGGEVAVQTKKIVEDNNIRTQIRPKFNVPYKTITTTGRAILYVLFIGYLLELYKLWILIPSTILYTIGVIILYVVIKLFFEKKQYNVLEYDFYSTKIEYKDGFLNKEEKELKYKHIREINMKQNILERMFNIGTIRIFTNATSDGYGYNNRQNNTRARNGIFIHCVENVQEQYKLAKQIIDEGTIEE